MRAKGRQAPLIVARGEANPRAKMTEAGVREARARHAQGQQIRPLARAFGVNRSVMRRILRGQKWTHVEQVS
jgi:hypothetical protein